MRTFTATLSTVLLLSLAGASNEPGAPVTLRVLTYNIHHGEGRDGHLDLERIANVMKSAQPDVIALQEVDQGTERSGGVDQLAALASMMGMHGAFGRAFDYSGGGYGVAVLSRWPLSSPDNRPLPSTVDREPRTALTVRVQAGGSGPWLRFTSTHLDSGRDSEDRLAQALYLNETLTSEDEEPAILAGDMNARLDTDVMQALTQHWMYAAPEVQQTEGRRRRRGPRGDYVLFRPAEHWRVVEARALDETVASDHRPVLIVLEWSGDG